MLHIYVRKISFEDPKVHALVRVLRFYLSDLKFVVEFYQLYQINMCLWHQILKIYRQPFVLIRKL